MNGIRERLRSADPRFGAILSALFIAVAAVGVVANSIRLVSASPGDYSIFATGAENLVSGRWSEVFNDPAMQAGPFELAFWSVPARLGIPSLPGDQGRIAWELVAIVAGLLAVAAVIAVAFGMLRDVTSSWRFAFAASVGAVVAVSGSIAQAMRYGHPAEFVIPLLWIWSALLASNGRPLAAGIVLGLAPGWEVWGILGAPVLLLTQRIDIRTVVRSGIGLVGVTLVTYLPFVILGPFTMFGFHWPIHPDTLIHLLFPQLTQYPWTLRAVQAALAVAVGVALAVLLRNRMDAVWLVPLAVCIVRLALDPTIQEYYGLPSVIFASCGLVAGIVKVRIAQAASCLAVYLVLVEFGPLSGPRVIAALAITAVAAVLVLRARSGTRGGRDLSPVS